MIQQQVVNQDLGEQEIFKSFNIIIMKKITILAAMAALIFTACSQDENLQYSTGSHTILASMESNGSESRTAFDRGTGDLYWISGDDIAVLSTAGNFTHYTLTDGAGTANATFTAATKLGENTTYALHPFSAHKYVNSVLTYNLPATYVYDETEKGNEYGAAPMIAVTDEPDASNFYFEHLGGAFCFTIKNIPADATYFKFEADEQITGDFAVTTDRDGKNIISLPTTHDATVTANSVTINFPAEGVLSNKRFFVPLPVGTFNGFKISIGTSEGEAWSHTSTATNTIERRKLLAMPIITLDAIVNGTVATGVSTADELQSVLEEGGSAILADDIELTSPLVVAKDKVVNIYLNGKTLEYSSDVLNVSMITNNGTLNISDFASDNDIVTFSKTVTEGKITFIYTGEADATFSKGNYAITNQGTLIVDGGLISIQSANTAEYTKFSHALYAVQNAGTLTVNGGKIVNPNNVAVRMWVGSETVASTLNLNGGEIEGLRAIWIQLPSSDKSKAPLANINVTNGTLTSWAGETDDSGSKLAIYSYSNGNNMKNVLFNISGGTFNGDIALTGGSNKDNIETVNISGGTFNGLYGDVYSYGDVAKAKETITIIGGLFSSLDPMQYLNSENEKVTLANDITIESESTYLMFNGVGTLDLNGKTITGTDKRTSGNFYLIDNRGTLTIEGNGNINLTAENNREWNASSVVVANNPGGNLTINSGVVIEHFGGSDMAYGVDNLTNGKGTSAVTTINGATVKSTYRAVRQFLNGIEATNELYVKSGIIEGANKSIWMQDPSNKNNTGKLVVEAGVQLKGDVYLYVTPGSAEWPVEVSIAAASLVGESQVLTGNVPEGYEVFLNGDTYIVIKN